MKAYKLFRKSAVGAYHSLFINKVVSLPLNEWLEAQCYPTNGFAVRAGWHCTLKPVAPHLVMNPKNGMRRVWCEVEVEDVCYHNRPVSQGGTWVTAQRLRLVREL